MKQQKTMEKKKKSGVFKVLSGSIREYKRAAIASPIFVAGEVVLECTIPFVMALLINSVEASNMNNILMYGGILLAMAAVSLVAGMFSGVYAAKASAGFAKNLRRDEFYAIQGFSFANIDKFSTSSLVTRLTTDITNVQMAFMMIIRIAIRTPLMFIFALAMSFSINVELACIFLCVIPVLAGGLILGIVKVKPLYDRLFKKYDKLNESVQENIAGIRVVKTFVREDSEKEKMRRVSDDVRKGFVRAEKIMALINPLMQFCMFVTMLLLSFFGARAIIASGGTGLSTGDLTSLITYATQILSSLIMLAMVLVMITMANSSAKRIVEVLEEQPTIVAPENALKEVQSGDITFENTTFRYSSEAEKDALSSVNLTIKSGQTVGILGGTGSSKSTLVQLIPRLYDVTSGAVKVGGKDVREYDLVTLRDSIAMVLQKNVLFSGTIADNIRWGNENATDEQVEQACKLACADEFIQTFPEKYNTHIEQGGTNVSGGQRQRLCIARALLKNPKVLILDDSTSAVDTRTDAMIRSAFRKNIPDTTKIIIAQRVASVQDADFIVVMDGGKIVGSGTHDELLKNSEIYREVYQSQNKGSQEPQSKVKHE